LTTTMIVQTTRTALPGLGQGHPGPFRRQSWSEPSAEALRQPKPEPQQRCRESALDAGLALSPDRIPEPQPNWAATVAELARLVPSPVPPPPWWKMHARFRASIQTLAAPSGHCVGHGSTSLAGASPTLLFYLTVAGWGHLHVRGKEPHKLGPGQGFLATDAIAVSHCLPDESPGWMFLRIEIDHPYLRPRLAKQASNTGALVDLRPDEPLTSSVVRLVRGAIMQDFQDQFAAEMALFDLVLTFERRAQKPEHGNREAERLMDDVRLQVLARLPKAIEVHSLAQGFGMSRSHFSHIFRKHTGMSPARFATEVRIQRAERMLLDTYEPLKTIADACGFASANHLCKVFRRFRHSTPNSFRRVFRPS
jgi:AraC-like DNA-binding protein